MRGRGEVGGVGGGGGGEQCAMPYDWRVTSHYENHSDNTLVGCRQKYNSY